jgi:hypothetical protein
MPKGSDSKQAAVQCKNCGKKFLIPAVDTERQEIALAGDFNKDAVFAFICPFCMERALYSAKDLVPL